MPQTRVKSSDNLGIELEAGRVSYHAGDIIIGTIYRKNTIVCTESSIGLVFHGRAKSLFVVNTGQSSAIYRGRFTLLNVSQEIFSGPLHIPKDTNERHGWKFIVKIPETVDASLLPKKFRPKESYLPLDPVSVGEQPIPPSFASIKRRTDQAFVEYYVEAKLRFQREGSWVEEIATMPIRILAHPHPPAHPGLTKMWRVPKSVTSQRLAPGMQNAQLTAAQKLKKLVGISSVPALAFHLEVEVPTQINSGQRGIPIKMRAVPQWEATHEALRNQPQTVRLVNFKATLEARCDILCEGYSWAANKQHWRERLVLPAVDLASPGTVVEIPLSTDEPAANVGEMIDLRVESNGKNSAAFQDFTTFNITFKHKLAWRAKLEIARETVSVDGKEDVIVLPPIDSSSGHEFIGADILPDYETDSSMDSSDRKGEPPSFEEAQKGDQRQSIASGTKGEAKDSGRSGIGKS